MHKRSIISENIKKYRAKLGISQDKLSKLSDVTYNTIIKIESGATYNPRVETLKKIADVITEFQSGYMEHGPSHLKPLRMKDVANRIGIHESTVSRAIQGKYMETPHDTTSLKSFFTSSVATDGGGVESQTSTVERIRGLIEKENPAKPLSDQQLMACLKEEGIRVARRTVAKHRDRLRILPSHLRRRESAA